MVEAFEFWTRLHQIKPSVTLEIAKTRSDAPYVAGAEGWPLPSHFARSYQLLWDAQRAAEDVFFAYFPHDCKEQGCGEWNPTTSRHGVTYQNFQQLSVVLPGTLSH